jgi:hypothetical protein
MSHVNKVQPICVKNDMHSSNTCDMYMCRLRHIHDPVLLSLKMEGIRLRFFLVVSLRRRTAEPSYSVVELDSQCPRLLRHAILKLLVRNPMELSGNAFRSRASLQKLRTS